jgi:hypothetical protein
VQDLNIGLVDREDRFRRENLSDYLALLVIQPDRLIELTANQGEARARCNQSSIRQKVILPVRQKVICPHGQHGSTALTKNCTRARSKGRTRTNLHAWASLIWLRAERAALVLDGLVADRQERAFRRH